MPDTQKKIEEFVEEERKNAHRPTGKGWTDKWLMELMRRAIAYGLRLSCEMGPEPLRFDDETNPIPKYLDDERNGWIRLEEGHHLALTQRNEAVREMATRVEKI